MLQQWCGKCHGAQNPGGGVNLSAYNDVTAIQKDQATWRKLLTQLRERMMPPPGAPQPPPEQRDRLIAWVSHTLDSADDSLLPKNPGRVLIHRLSRTEYNNTLRDLLGVDTRPADNFPADGSGGGGFDNNADTLFVPPILMERYLQAASEALDQTRPERICFVKPGKTLSKEAAARKILTHFATLGFRRPVDPAEVDHLMRLFQQADRRGQPFTDSVKFALKGVLVSPKFLFRIEADRPTPGPYPLNDYELAGRLSYFLWASMPDTELFALAAQKRLHAPGVLEHQVQRMLADKKAHDFADSFAGQWLRTRDLYTTAKPDPNRFPAFTPALRDAMYNETIDFVQSVFQDNASVLDLIDADYTYLNQDLATYYGIPGVQGRQMRRVSLADHRRGGVLTMASVLTITSYAERTSPVLRGKWVLEQVLGAPPPPPPPNAGGLSADDSIREGLTFRQRLEKHREKPQCAGCHSKMDPIGFGLENFDAIGRWRTQISGQPVDAGGVLADGSKFSGPIELKQHILGGKEEFVRNLTEKLLAYALGRGLETYDLPAVRKISAAVVKDSYHSRTLITEIVKSYPFQYRQN